MRNPAGRQSSAFVTRPARLFSFLSIKLLITKVLKKQRFRATKAKAKLGEGRKESENGRCARPALVMTFAGPVCSSLSLTHTHEARNSWSNREPSLLTVKKHMVVACNILRAFQIAGCLRFLTFQSCLNQPENLRILICYYKLLTVAWHCLIMTYLELDSFENLTRGYEMSCVINLHLMILISV
jgi:hypothetical protein